MEKKIRIQTEENKTKKDYIIRVKVTLLTLVLFTQYYKFSQSNFVVEYKSLSLFAYKLSKLPHTKPQSMYKYNKSFSI